jgi:enoyl-CoA hydratase/carnithine racemase
MAFTELRRETDGTARLTLQRAPANAVDLAFAHALTDRIGELAADLPAAVLFTGIEGFFCAGADLKRPPLGAGGVAAINHLTHDLYALPCPLIGAITGHAIGIGFVLTLCCDARIASDAGRYGLNEVGLGFPYPPVTLDVLRAEAGPSATRQLVLGSELHDGPTCRRLRLFDEVLEPAAVLPRAEAETRRRAVFPDRVYSETKAALRAETLAAMARTLAATAD